MQFKTLYKVRNVERISGDERYGRLLYNPGEQYPILVNSHVPELWPAEHDIEKLEYWFMSVNATFDDLNDYELIDIEVEVDVKFASGIPKIDLVDIDNIQVWKNQKTRYRLMAYEEEDGLWLRLNTVFYKDGTPIHYGNGATFHGETKESIAVDLQVALKALDEPIIWAGKKFPDLL